MKPQIEKERNQFLSEALKHLCASQAVVTVLIINDAGALFKPFPEEKNNSRGPLYKEKILCYAQKNR